MQVMWPSLWSGIVATASSMGKLPEFYMKLGQVTGNLAASRSRSIRFARDYSRA